MYRRDKEERNPNRIERLIENMPLQIADNLHLYLQDYKDGKISRKEFAKKINVGIMVNIEATCNSIDSAMERQIEPYGFTCRLRKRS